MNRTPPWHRRYEERTAAWRATQERVLDAIGATLWRPLTDWLAGAGVASAPLHPARPIVILAGIGLVTLPLHAARWEDGTQVVHACDRYEITYAPSVAVIQSCLERRRQQGGPIRLLAVQNPTGRTGRSNLAWSEVEADAACRACPDHVRLASLNQDRFEPATRERLKRELPGHTIALLATHGIYDSTRPWTKSGLFTADASPPGTADPQLTIDDFYEMDLGRSQLILLTACESGLTDPLDKAGEQSGLASAMLASGASAVIASLWAVDDMSTALLIRRFFEEVMREPRVSIAAALAAAQGWLRQLRAEDADHLLADIEQQLPSGSRDSSPLARPSDCSRGADGARCPRSVSVFARLALGTVLLLRCDWSIGGRPRPLPDGGRLRNRTPSSENDDRHATQRKERTCPVRRWDADREASPQARSPATSRFAPRHRQDRRRVHARML